MIQKRTTMVGSFQPCCSKWWWIGAMRNTRLPVRLKTNTWTMTETRLHHEQPADDGEHDLVLGCDRDRAQSAARARGEPVSPMNITAGGALNHRKPSRPHDRAAEDRASSPGAAAR